MPTDEQRATTAAEKLGRGETPTKTELAAYERQKRIREERALRLLIKSVPKKLYCQITGRQPKVVNEQADRYGVPLRGDTIDVGNVLEWLHDFLAKHGRTILAQSPDDLLLEGASQQLKDAYVREQIKEKAAKAKLAELDLAQRSGELVLAAEIHDHLTRFASILRRTGEALQRRFGPDAQRILDKGLDDCDREIEARFGATPPTQAATKKTAKRTTKKTAKKKAAKKKTTKKATDGRPRNQNTNRRRA